MYIHMYIEVRNVLYVALLHSPCKAYCHHTLLMCGIAGGLGGGGVGGGGFRGGGGRGGGGGGRGRKSGR